MTKNTPALTPATSNNYGSGIPPAAQKFEAPKDPRFCNALMANVPHEQARATFGWFTPPARAGAEDALRYRSLGAGC